MADVIRLPVRSPSRASRLAQPEAGNRLLARLPVGDFDRLREHLVSVPARQRQTFQRAGEPIRYVYFPGGGVFSVTTALPEGTFTETAAIGREGLLGIEAFFHQDARAAADIVLQVEGEGRIDRLDVDLFRRAVAERGALHDVVGRYAHALLAQTMQGVACNALHTVHQRLAKWLLLTDDRLEHPAEFRVSHESLSLILGTRRQTITVIARAFQEAGLITYKHARVRVLDRLRLEAAACLCYRAIREHIERVHRGV